MSEDRRSAPAQGGSPKRRPIISYLTVKRIVDVTLALILAVPAALIIGVCVLAIKIESRGPAFFVQRRPGYKGRVFTIYKLRTMRTDGGKNGDAKAETERITRSGRLIRAGSLDELPQIFNIIKGEMSFIGPRPLLEKYLPLYTAEQMRRHDVLPGISGWAQVNGRNELSWEQKFALDVWYVDHVSARLDMRIFLKTIVNLFRRKGIYAQENLIVGEYRGREQHG